MFNKLEIISRGIKSISKENEKNAKKPDGWFYKTATDWEEETGLTRREQDTARKHLKNTSFWIEKLKGVPATMHYKIDSERLFSSFSKSAKLDLQFEQNSQTSFDKSAKHSITETTTETTLSESKDSDSQNIELVLDGGGYDLSIDKPNTKRLAKKLEVPEYKDFCRIWDEKYHHIGFKMPRDGSKIKSLILETRRQLGLIPLEATSENVIEFWQIFINNLHKTWGHGKDLAVIESKYPSLIFEMEKGKKVTPQNSASMAFGKYANS